MSGNESAAMYSTPEANRIARRLREMANFPRHHCFRCDERNSIENVYFCMNPACYEVVCWQCVKNRKRHFSLSIWKLHPACICGSPLKLWGDWDSEIEKLRRC